MKKSQHSILRYFHIWIITMFFSLPMQSQNPNWQWVNSMGGGYVDYLYDMKIDPQGNSFITGLFYNTASFDTTSLFSAGNSDIYFAKLNANGNVVWAKRAGGTGIDAGSGICVDRNGSIFLTGSFGNVANFDSISLTNPLASGEIFIAKYNAAGNVQWAKPAAQGVGYDNSKRVLVDSSGNIFIAGTYWDSTIIGNTTLHSNKNSSIVKYDIFLAKYNSSGNAVWATSFGGKQNESILGMTLTDDGSVYIVGTFSDTAYFDNYTLVSRGGSEIYIAKLNATGHIIWAKSAGGINTSSPTYGESALDIKIDANSNLYIVGTFSSDTTYFDPQILISNTINGGSYIAKYDSAGNCIWVKQTAIGSVNTVAYGLCINSSDEVLMTGWFNGTANFGATTLVANSNDLFVCALDSLGNFLWAKQSMGNGNAGTYGISIAVDSFDKIYIGGQYQQGTTSFGPSTITCSGLVYSDVFVVNMHNGITGLTQANVSYESIDISPNPFAIQAILSFKHTLNKASILLYNSFGQIVQHLESVSGNYMPFYREKLGPGLYLLQINEKDRNFKPVRMVIVD